MECGAYENKVPDSRGSPEVVGWDGEGMGREGKDWCVELPSEWCTVLYCTVIMSYSTRVHCKLHCKLHCT